MTTDRSKPLGFSIRELERLWPRLSTEEWAARDAEVAAQREAGVAPIRSACIEALIEHGWPRHIIDGALAADPRREAMLELRALEAPRRRMVVLSGAAGCGKSVAACRWTMDGHRGARFVRASTFARASRYATAEEGGIGLWLTHPALVLDDLGAEYLDAKGSFLVDLDELIDTYYADRRALLITTNCNARTFAARYGARIVDRLNECAVWISVREGSLRGDR